MKRIVVTILTAAVLAVVGALAPVEKARGEDMPSPAATFGDAQRWYTRAAEAGDAEAQFLLGRILEDGLRGRRDPAQAAKWYERAARQGHARAQERIGRLYYDGTGVERDFARAAEWTERAAENGVVAAQYNIGLMYARGQGVERDTAKAVRWYRKAANAGVGAAQFTLGVMLATGKGVPRDPVEALKWLDLAAKAGQPVDRDFRDSVARSLTPEEREKTERDVREFQVSNGPVPRQNLAPATVR